MCAFPGCDRPARERKSSKGRPPAYCDDPEHNWLSANAGKRRRRHVAAAAVLPPREDEVAELRRRGLPEGARLAPSCRCSNRLIGTDGACVFCGREPSVAA